MSIIDEIEQLDGSWQEILLDTSLGETYKNISTILSMETTFYPPTDKIFNSMKYFTANEVKVVVQGQDPKDVSISTLIRNFTIFFFTI